MPQKTGPLGFLAHPGTAHRLQLLEKASAPGTKGVCHRAFPAGAPGTEEQCLLTAEHGACHRVGARHSTVHR